MQQLLPGIPDDITLNRITTKLPWTAFQILTSVSCGWRHAVRSHEVHDARVRSHSTETLVLVNFHCPFVGESRIVLYSKRDNWSYALPPIPYLDGHIPQACRWMERIMEIVVHGGIVLNADYFYGRKERRRDNEDSQFEYANFVEIYDPFTDDWRVVETFERENDLIILAHGKFHSISALGISCLWFDKKSWTTLHSFSLAAMGPVGSTVFRASPIQFVDKELVALVDWVNQDEETCGSCLILSEGFGSKEIEWKK